MRVLHCISSVNPADGGPIEGLKQIAAVLNRSGYGIEVATLDSGREPWLKDFPLPVHALGPTVLHYRFSPRWTPWIRENAANYDAVIINGIWQYHSFGAWMGLRGSSTPYFVLTHGMLNPWFKRRYPLKHAKKWLYWPWGDYRVLRDARAVLFTCERERELARESFGRYRCHEIVVGYGTSLPPGQPAAQRRAFLDAYPQLRGRRLVLFMGRIHPVKACDQLIAAFAEMFAHAPEWRLVMVGCDQVGWKASLVALAARLGAADRITWIENLSGDLKWGAFRAADVFVLPSHCENFGMVAAEALACGLPVLASDQVNICREIAQDGAGLIAMDDLEGTRHLLRVWREMPASDREQYRSRAEQCFRQRFEIHHVAQNLANVLTSYRHPFPEAYAAC
jgi:glycosyltransferase involved in cell wall biosynthesis